MQRLQSGSKRAKTLEIQGASGFSGWAKNQTVTAEVAGSSPVGLVSVSAFRTRTYAYLPVWGSAACEARKSGNYRLSGQSRCARAQKIASPRIPASQTERTRSARWQRNAVRAAAGGGKGGWPVPVRSSIDGLSLAKLRLPRLNDLSLSIRHRKFHSQVFRSSASCQLFPIALSRM